MNRRIYVACINNDCPAIYNYLYERLSNLFSVPFDQLHINLDMLSFYNSNREQYDAYALIKELLNYINDEQSKVLGITGKDLFIPILTYVFGLGYLGGNSGIVSYYRLRNEFYGLEPNEELLLVRTYKVILHELGHLYGLKHCNKSWCVMYSANTIDDLDIKNDMYCIECADHMQKSLNDQTMV
ncbi:MAG: archaemetzincin family Zn-dependent metalloprotease [Calditrichia bacterium]